MRGTAKGRGKSWNWGNSSKNHARRQRNFEPKQEVEARTSLKKTREGTQKKPQKAM